MWVKQLFSDIRDSKLTMMDQLTALERVTDGHDPNKLKQLHSDLTTFIKNTLRGTGSEAVHVYLDCIYEVFNRENKANKVLTGITKEQFISALNNGIEINPDYFKEAAVILTERHGKSYDNDLADFLELKSFERIVYEKIRESDTSQETVNELLQGKNESPYSLDDTRLWFIELCKHPDYQRHDGSPYITAIDAELRKRHSHKVGQTPSETTIKNHRRKLGFMQK